jgi:hypothetical protein
MFYKETDRISCQYIYWPRNHWSNYSKWLYSKFSGLPVSFDLPSGRVSHTGTIDKPCACRYCVRAWFVGTDNGIMEVCNRAKPLYA